MPYLIIATICFSLSFGLIKDQLSVLPSELVVFCRLFIAALVFLPFFKKLTVKTHLTAFFIGMVQFGLMYLLFIKAFKFLQGNEIAILTTTTPVFVAIWSSIFGEKFKPVYIFCILMSVIGAGFIVWHNMTFNMIVKGVVLMESCNCSFALGQVLWKKFIGHNDGNLMASAYTGAFLFVLPFTLFCVDFSNIMVTKGQILSILYLAVVPTGVGFWLWNKGAEQVKYSTLAVMNNLKIPLGVLFAIFIFHEKIDLMNFIIGSSIILFAIFVLHYVLKHENN
ncbi:EamA family transporter [bacterium]|nr:EamA family transporter [bacterium]